MKKNLFSYPKINLAFDILERTDSDYHKIRTVFHELDELKDEITIELCDDPKIELKCDNKEVPCGSDSPVIKAAEILRKKAKVKGGAKIFIKKRIPLCAGLGGASSNVAAVLKGLSEFWAVHRDFLVPIAQSIGADCAFFLYGGTALGENFGELVTPLPPLKGLNINIIDTGIKIPTENAYKSLNLAECGQNSKETDMLIQGIREGDPNKVFQHLHNDFEFSVYNRYPILAQKKEELIRANPKSKVLLCGSGGSLALVTVP